MNVPALPMTKSEVAKLLALIASYDRRTVGVTDVESWHRVALHAGWTFHEACPAVVAQAANNPAWIVPAHLTERIREARRSAPPSVDDLRGRADAHRAGELLGRSYIEPSKPPSDPTPMPQWRRDRAVEFIDTHTDALRAALTTRNAG